MERQGSNWVHRAVLTLLALALLLPGLLPPGDLQEGREPVPLPKWRGWGPSALAEFAQGFDLHWRDQLGWRAWLVSRRAELILALGSSPKPASVTVGPQGWLFWTGQTLRFRSYAQSLSEKSADPVLEQFRATQAQLAKEGIRFLVVYVPDKAFFAPEQLPESWRKPFFSLRFSQHRWVRRMTLPGDPPLVDPGKALKASPGPVFRALDNHWTDHAACLTYLEMQEVLGSWFPSVEPLKEMVRGQVNLGGRQAAVAGLLDMVEPVQEVGIPGDWSPSLEFVRDRFWRSLPVVTVGPDLSKPRALVFQTSQGMALQPFLSKQFSRVVFLRWGLSSSWDWVERENPDVVIFLSHEATSGGMPIELQGLRQWKPLAAEPFEGGYQVAVGPESRVLHGEVVASEPTTMEISWEDRGRIWRAQRALVAGENTFHVTVGDASKVDFTFDQAGEHELRTVFGSPNLARWANR